jgi:hypothetical protein
MGGGLDNQLTNKMLTPNISLRSCLAKQLRDVCDAGVTHHWLLFYCVANVNELFASRQAKQITEFGLGLAETYSILHQPGMPDEQCLNTEHNY